MHCGRSRDLVIKTLHFGSSGPGTNPGWVITLCGWKLTVAVPRLLCLVYQGLKVSTGKFNAWDKPKL